MRVKCEQVFSASSGEEISHSPWLRRGGEYLVLSIDVEVGGKAYYRLIGDDGFKPILVDSKGFSTTSTAIPPSWVAIAISDGRLRIGPEGWMREGFWEAYFDGESDSKKEFEAALDVLVKHDRSNYVE